MRTIPEYPLQEIIDESREALLYRSRRPENKTACLVKAFKTSNPSPSVLARFTREYDVIRTLNVDGILNIIDVLIKEDGIAIILEDFQGRPLPLGGRTGNPFSVEAVLKIAVQLAETIGQLHQAGVVHGNIRPRSILIDSDDRLVKVTGFGVEAELSVGNNDSYHPETIRGTLAYISPEQTGRLKQPVGEGTDFYSLGVVFYEMLTGRLPFIATDPSALIHAHMAAAPMAPGRFNEAIPAVLSDIVMKLLSKNPEERYRNGFGLMHDLRECLDRFERQGVIAPFSLAQKDFSSHFCISRKMVGREEEIETLQQVFDRVETGRSECVLVGGATGIGKSATIHEFQKQMPAGDVYFISGKYDQFRSQEPYASLYQVLRDLVRQVLAESPRSIKELQKRLSVALAPNARIVTDAIPELELIMGEQPAIRPLGIEEEKNRFDRVLKNFIRVFATASRPLVVFMDDLQWADEESLRFMRHIVGEEAIGRLMWVGAYRDVSAGEDTEPSDLPEEMRKIGCRVTYLRMRPMNLQEVNTHISGILNCEPRQTLSLAELIHSKTRGNPFFVNQFMSALHENRLFIFSPTTGWQWDIRAIQQQEMAENVAALLADRLAALPESTRELLKICACVGVRFNLATVAAVLDQPMASALSHLQPAISEGLVERTEDTYYFTHDRIQETAYERIPEEDRSFLNYRIGKQILSRMDARGDRSKLFFAVNKLNQGISFIRDPKEIASLRNLNMEAGQKAKNAAAYVKAADFFRTALRLLPADAWRTEYETSLAVHLNLAVCEHLSHRFDTAEQLFDLALGKAVSHKDRAEVYNLKLLMLANLTRFREALEAGRQGLKLLGVKLPKNGGKWSILWLVGRIRFAVGRRQSQELLDLPIMTDESVFLSMKILMNMTMSAYFISTDYSILIALKMMELSLKHGNSSISPYAYAIYGVTMGSGFGKYAMGVRFGQIARKLHHRLGLVEIEAKILLIVGGGILVWNRPVGEALGLTRKALDAAMENGDLNSAIYAVQSIVILMTHQGTSLDELTSECKRHLDFIARTKDPGALNSLLSILQFAKSLRGETASPFSMDDESFTESDHIRNMKDDGIPIILGRHYILKMQLQYLQGRYDQAFQSALESEKRIGYSMGMIVMADHYFYMALIVLELLWHAGAGRRLRLLKKAATCRRNLKRWARICPQNFRHKHLLVSAETARLKGHERQAMNAYDQAVSAARENGYIQDAALADERAALFYLNIGLERLAAPLMNEARNSYLRWGARAKARQLEQRYPYLMKESVLRESVAEEDHRAVILSTIDLRTLRSALKTLAEETIHSRMVEKTIRNSIQIAGAQRGILILRNEAKELYIEGEGSVDRAEVTILQSIPLESFPDISQAVVNYVRRTGENIVVHSVEEPQKMLPQLFTDPYIQRTGVKSLLCLPIRVATGSEKEMLGLVYLENSRATHAFTSDIVEMLEIICLSAAGRLELSRKAVKDGLTGLYNHDYFQNVLRQEMILSQRQNRQLSLLMIDIDHFKRFNDTWGHQVGDAVLQQVSTAIGTVCRKSDIIARYGGEEIAIILRETDAHTAFNLGEKLRKTIEELGVPHPGRPEEILRVTVSLGIAVYPLDAANKNGLIQMADEALYRSKARGRNRVTGRHERVG